MADRPGSATDPVVVCAGDSITEAGVGPSGYVTLLAEGLERHGVRCRVVGAGISGDRVPDLRRRLAADVLRHRPALVIVYVGINDVWHSLQGSGTPVEEFRAGLAEILTRARAAGAEVVLCTPSVIGECSDGSNPLDEQLEEYAAVSRSVAAHHGATLVDLRALFVGELRDRNPGNRSDSILTADGVHLNDAGNRFVADCLLPVVTELLPG